MSGLPDLTHLNEGHQFFLLVTMQVAQLISTILLWRSSPHTKPPQDLSKAP